MNFVGAVKELKEIYQFVQRMTEEVEIRALQGIDWRFILPILALTLSKDTYILYYHAKPHFNL